MDARVRRLVKRCAGVAGKPYPVEVVPGGRVPTLVGEPGHWETRGGERVRHPSAYSRKGGSNLVYRRSTLRVVVGVETLVRLEAFAADTPDNVLLDAAGEG